MNESNNEQDEKIVECPVCGGDGLFRGLLTRIPWFRCGYCVGTGRVTEKRFHAWEIDTVALSPPIAVSEGQSDSDAN